MTMVFIQLPLAFKQDADVQGPQKDDAILVHPDEVLAVGQTMTRKEVEVLVEPMEMIEIGTEALIATAACVAGALNWAQVD
jgi:hypothetical protein